METPSKKPNDRRRIMVIVGGALLVFLCMCVISFAAIASLDGDKESAEIATSTGEEPAEAIVALEPTASSTDTPVPATDTPPATPAPTSTPEPSDTPQPTNTPEPSNTPQPTSPPPTASPNATGTVAYLALDYITSAGLITIGTLQPAMEDFGQLFTLAGDTPAVVLLDDWNDLVLEAASEIFEGCKEIRDLEAPPELLVDVHNELVLACEQYELMATSVTDFVSLEDKLTDQGVQHLLDATEYMTSGTEHLQLATEHMEGLTEYMEGLDIGD